MEAIEVEGSESIEVVAQFDGAIVDVAHIVRDDGAEPAARRRRWLLGGGAAALGVAAAAFVCAYAGAPLGRAVDVVVAACLVGGTWALMRAIDRGGRFAPQRAYTIGPDPRASFAVDAAAVPAPAFALVRVDDAGDFVLDVAAGMCAQRTAGDRHAQLTAGDRHAQLSAGVKHAPLTADGTSAPLPPGTHRLAAGARASVKAGGATFFVANVPAPRRQAMARGIDWTREVYLGGVTLVVSAFLFLVYAVPPSPEALALDLVHDNHFARFVLMAPELPPPPPMPGPASDTASAGHAARDKAGTLGK
ncbi:MAG TPA: hypothetical protein VF945_04990, partial [Polyangia bacterium]